MSHATMYFEDSADGLIDFRIDWHDSNVNPKSEAHKTALMVYNFLDQQAKVKHDTTTTDRIQNGHNNEGIAILIPVPQGLVIP